MELTAEQKACLGFMASLPGGLSACRALVIGAAAQGAARLALREAGLARKKAEPAQQIQKKGAVSHGFL